MRTPSPIRPLALTSFGLAIFLAALPLRADDGDLDTTFQGGTVTQGWMSSSVATDLVAAEDGDLFVGGVRGSEPPFGESQDWVVAKFDPDGDDDATWGSGFSPVDFEAESGTSDTRRLLTMARGAGGTLLLAGSVEVPSEDARPALARLLPSGALDTTFAGNGLDIVTDLPAGWTEVTVGDAQFLPDGRSVFAGSCEGCVAEGQAIWVARRLANGNADTSFSGDGWLTFQLDPEEPSSVAAIELYEDGRILIAGRTSIFISGVSFLARVGATGGLDASFGGGDGVTDAFAPGTGRRAEDLAIDPDTGRIAVAIYTHNSEVPDEGSVYAFTSTGLEDLTFSGDGEADLDTEEGTTIESVEFQSDGKLLAVGRIDANGSPVGGFYLVRLTTTGQLDATFDGNGVKRVEIDYEGNDDDSALAVRTVGGKLVAAGFAETDGGAGRRMAIVRTESALIFTDGFERQTLGGWAGY